MLQKAVDIVTQMISHKQTNSSALSSVVEIRVETSLASATAPGRLSYTSNLSPWVHKGVCVETSLASATAPVRILYTSNLSPCVHKGVCVETSLASATAPVRIHTKVICTHTYTRRYVWIRHSLCAAAPGSVHKYAQILVCPHEETRTC